MSSVHIGVHPTSFFYTQKWSNINIGEQDGRYRQVNMLSGTTADSVNIGMDDRISMSISKSGDCLSDETLNRGPWRCS